MQQDQPDEEGDGSHVWVNVSPEPAQEPEVFYVHPDNWTAYRVFEACITQWRVIAGMGGIIRQGLEYPSVMTVMDAWGIKKRRKIFNQVRLLEAGALSVINEQQNVPDNAANPG